MQRQSLFYLIFLTSVLFVTSSVQATNYYVDSQKGNDDYVGTKVEKPWKTLMNLRGKVLQAGDSLLFKRGSVFTGQLTIVAAGTASAPVYVGAYGEGKRPLFNASEPGGDCLYAIKAYNSQYLTIRGLEITNHQSAEAKGRSGILIESVDYGISYNITLDSLYVHDVNGFPLKTYGGIASGNAIRIHNGGISTVSYFDGVTIENCHIKDCQRNGICFYGYTDRSNWHPNRHVVIRGNLIENVPGDQIVAMSTDSALVEYNVVRNPAKVMLANNEWACGIWAFSADNTVIQYNDVQGLRTYGDGQAYDCDYNCKNTTIQYNYSSNNFGGTVLVCSWGKVTGTANIGNINPTFRYNLSIGDGTRTVKSCDDRATGANSPAIKVCGPVNGATIEKNIIHCNTKPAAAPDYTMLVTADWVGYPVKTHFYNNVLYSTGTGEASLYGGHGTVCRGNWYLGNWNTIPQDSEMKTESGYYQRNIINADASGYKGLLRLTDEKQILGETAHIVNKERMEKFFQAFTAKKSFRRMVRRNNFD